MFAAFSEECRRIDIVGVGVTEIEVELAEKITSLVPCAEQVVLLSTGTEATFYAVRLARGVTGRRLLIKFQGCFHGSHDAVALQRHLGARPASAAKDPLSIGILPDVIDATLIAPVQRPRGGATRQSPSIANEIAAIILEPIPHNIGACCPTQSFLRGAARRS